MFGNIASWTILAYLGTNRLLDDQKLSNASIWYYSQPACGQLMVKLATSIGNRLSAIARLSNTINVLLDCN